MSLLVRAIKILMNLDKVKENPQTGQFCTAEQQGGSDAHRSMAPAFKVPGALRTPAWPSLPPHALALQYAPGIPVRGAQGRSGSPFEAPGSAGKGDAPVRRALAFSRHERTGSRFSFYGTFFEGFAHYRCRTLLRSPSMRLHLCYLDVPLSP